MHTNVRLDEVQKRIERFNNPYLKQLPYTWIENKPLENYDGINLSIEKNTGNILRLRNVKKVGKDGSGTYLYWGYMYNSFEETNPEIKDLDKGAVPVCFELYKRLEDIAKEKNEDETIALLTFLSNPDNFKKSNTVKYIGHFFKKTIENKKEIIEEYRASTEKNSNSPTIQKQIEKIQRDYIQNSFNTDDRKDQEDAR